MTTAKTTPLILYSDLTKRYFIVTRYTQHPTHIEAHTKYDCTDQMKAITAGMVSLEDVEKAVADELKHQKDFGGFNELTWLKTHAIKNGIVARLKGKEG